MIVWCMVVLDGTDIDNDLAIVSASPPRNTTKFRRAEKGVWISVEVGRERSDAEHETGD